jgi:hypothetical protein
LTFVTLYPGRFVLLLLVLLVPLRNIDATTLDNLAECRSASTDNFSFRECVGLQHQASETLLTAIERSWRDYLDSALPGSSDSEDSEDRSQGASGNSKEELNAADTEVADKIIGDSGVETEPGSTVINITNETLLETDFPVLVREDVPDISVVAQRDRFDQLAEHYRIYRDQRCDWESGLFGADRVDVYTTACGAWLNQQRAQSLSVQLSEKRALDANGTFYRGFYIEDADGGIYQSCDRRQEWRMTGDGDILDEIATRYAAIDRDNLEMAYLELRGDRHSASGDSGISGTLRVRSVNLLRAIDEADCSARPVVVSRLAVNERAGGEQTEDEVGAPADSSVAPDDVTVDSLGASGFLYGYFSNWVSACAVDQSSVCMAQADSGLSGLGEWRLVVDRSLQRQWKVQLIPTISDTVIGRAIGINIDGVEVSARPVPKEGVAVKAEVGITLAEGDAALTLINRMRGGQLLSLGWSLPTEIGTELNFSLSGVTRALEFFDQNG